MSKNKIKDDTDPTDDTSDGDSFFFYLILFVIIGVVIGIGIIVAYFYGHYKSGDGKGQAKKFFDSSIEFLSQPGYN